MKPENCRSCRSWDQTTPDSVEAPATVRGVCRRFPPMPPEGRFPNTFAGVRCDEWREKREPEPEKTAEQPPTSALAVPGEAAKDQVVLSKDRVGWASSTARQIAVSIGGSATAPTQQQLRAELEIGKSLLAAYNAGWRDRGADESKPVKELPPGERR